MRHNFDNYRSYENAIAKELTRKNPQKFASDSFDARKCCSGVHYLVNIKTVLNEETCVPYFCCDSQHILESKESSMPDDNFLSVPLQMNAHNFGNRQNRALTVNRFSKNHSLLTISILYDFLRFNKCRIPPFFVAIFRNVFFWGKKK